MGVKQCERKTERIKDLFDGDGDVDVCLFDKRALIRGEGLLRNDHLPILIQLLNQLSGHVRSSHSVVGA